MKKDLSTSEALHKIAALCSTSEYCTNDIREKLRKWGIGESDIGPIIDRLISEKFIDDSRFCKGYINDKIRFGKWGKIKISYALRQKGIESGMIREALDGIDEKMYTALLSDVLQEKRKTIKSGTEYEVQARLYRFAISRGFEPQLVLKFIKSADELSE